MRALILGLLTLCTALPVQAADPEASMSPAGAWDHAAMLEGHWRQVKDGEVTEEIWMNNKANVVVGMSRTVKGLKNFYEFLRLENTKTGVIYIARPMGAKEETPFLLTVATPDKLVFTNPANDWPQMLDYRRTGPDTLEATASGIDPAKGKVLRFKWTRVK